MKILNPFQSLGRKFYSYLKKDFLLLIRRKKYLYLFLALPFIIGLIFLFFLNPSPASIKTGVCDYDNTELSREALTELKGFKMTLIIHENCTDILLSRIKSKEYSLGIEVPKGFSQDLNDLKQTKLILYYDNTDIAFSSLVAWKIDNALVPYEEAIINELSTELKSRVKSIRTGVDIIADLSGPSIDKRINEIDYELRKVEAIDTDFIVNPILTEKKPLYDKETDDAGIAFVFPIVALFVVLLLCSASFMYDKKNHFIMRVKTSTSPIIYLFAKYVFFFVITLINFLIILILFEIAGADFTYNIGQIINLIAFITVINTSIGLLIGLISDSEGVAILFSLIISLPFMLISGILYPIQTMPIVVQFFAKLIPLNYEVTYAKTVMLFGASFGYTWIYFGLALFASIYLLMKRKH